MPPLAKAAAGGIVAGIVTAAAMDLFQRAVAPLMGMASGSDDEPATAQAADSAATLATGAPVPAERQAAAGQIVHYLTGAGFGLAYGLIAARRPAITSGFGTVYAVGLATIADNGIVPLAGWGAPPWRSDAKTQVYGGASHLVFGAVLEATRRVIVAAGKDDRDHAVS